jgi:MtN3 and saliva related transmembrane protein
MNYVTIEMIGLIAGIFTSIGFVPQLVKGFRVKKLDDISYYMPTLLAIGMTLWFTYGFLINSIAVMVANGFSICCNVLLVFLKYNYSKK